MCATRTPINMWRKLPPGKTRDEYDRIQAELLRSDMVAAAVDSAMNSLYHFVCLATEDGSPDVQNLSGAREDMERAQAAWKRMQEQGHWNPKHTVRVRTQLSKALEVVAQSLASAVNPTMRQRKQVVFTTARSFQQTFDLHSCLPVRLRQCSPFDPEYDLISKVLTELSSHLKSISKAHLQRIALFLDVVIHGHACHALPAMWDGADPGADSASRWSWLRHQDAKHWIVRLGLVHRCTAKEKMSFEYFKRHMRYLHLLHSKVLCPGCTVLIPIPMCRMVTLPPQKNVQQATHATAKCCWSNLRHRGTRRTFLCILQSRFECRLIRDGGCCS